MNYMSSTEPEPYLEFFKKQQKEIYNSIIDFIESYAESKVDALYDVDDDPQFSNTLILEILG